MSDADAVQVPAISIRMVKEAQYVVVRPDYSIRTDNRSVIAAFLQFYDKNHTSKTRFRK